MPCLPLSVFSNVIVFTLLLNFPAKAVKLSWHQKGFDANPNSCEDAFHVLSFTRVTYSTVVPRQNGGQLLRIL